MFYILTYTYEFQAFGEGEAVRFYSIPSMHLYVQLTMKDKYLFIITNTMHTLGVDKITLFKTT